jgi:hypothetical protein
VFDLDREVVAAAAEPGLNFVVAAAGKFAVS